MATLSLSVGATSATINASDANAARILRGTLAQYGYDVDSMTNQEQADAVIAETVAFYNASATAHETSEASEAARLAIVEAPPVFGE